MSDPVRQSVRIVRPAPFWQARALLSPRSSRTLMGAVATLTLSGATFGLMAGDKLGALLAFWPESEGVEEVAFCVAPDVARAHMIAGARKARLILQGRAHSVGVRFAAHVRIGHEPGRRLAAITGFVPFGPWPPLPGFERWEFRPCLQC